MAEGFLGIIGMKPDFNYHGKDRSYSNCGNFTGIFVFLFVCWAFYQVGNDIFFKENPIVVSSKIFIDDPGKVVIDPNEFIFALGLERPDNYAHYIDNGIFNVKAVHYNMKRVRDSNGNIKLVETNTDLELEVCTLNHFGEKQSLFANLEYNSLYCLKPNQPNMDQVIIKGKFEVDEVSFLKFAFYACNNATSNNTCKPKEDIDYLLSGAYFAVYYTDVAIDPKNYTQPERLYMDAKFTIFGNSYFKAFQIWINHNEVTTDSGWLMEDSSIRYSNSFDELKEFLDLRSAGDQFLEFQIRVSPYYNYYQRAYIKVQDILANVEGLLTVVLVTVAILILPYVKLKFYEGLIGEVFDVNASLDYFHHGQRPKYISPGKIDGQSLNFVPKKSKEKKLSPVRIEEDPQVIQKDRRSSIEQSLFSQRGDLKKDEGSSELLIDHTARKKELSLYSGKPDKQSTIERKPEFKVISEQAVGDSFSIDIKDEVEVEPETKTGIGLVVSSSNHGIPEIIIKEAPTSDPIDNQVQMQDLAGKKRNNTVFTFDKRASDSVFQDYGDMNENQFIYRSVANIDSNLKASLHLATPIPEDNKIKRKLSRVRKVVEPETQEKINLSAIEYLRSYFSQSKDLKKKMKIIHEGQRRIEERLDVFNILKKLREIDKLKALLLDKDQLILFDYLPKPVLDYTEMVSNISSESVGMLRDPEFVKIREAVFQDSYHNIYKRTKKSPIDHKLIDIYDGLI